MGIIFDKPLIGVVMCQNHIGSHLGQTVHNKYLDAIVLSGGVPLPLPHQLMLAPHLLENSMTLLDGILLTGSPSNIEPWHYGEEGKEEHADPARDRLAFGLITHAIGKKMPIFGICRGLQELVVANGGALYRQLHMTHLFQEHREDDSLSLERQYAAVHDVQPEPEGLLSQVLGSADAFAVNSLHGQGIREPGPQLRVEARAPDGLIEAVSLRQHPFALAVQWHPEWHSDRDPVSQRLFGAFINAAVCYHKEKQP
ncbi:gamma-glutamyl-gamma-aminobutyrate hydrolase [Pantoea sp. Acro-805]|jgi:gamma-glutamyl-gamma-aminobutyrate hydrolase|uniref:Gamma-glutamyl-gamma-aminobutyrate hydrolase n=1 Tax=Candidatus Pantoea formicae TaxID=2608355 RepID=A0ABX0R330_9GAMM|nr:gamma-glutamyl-gamma-aminobutyrate hydrolase [Pantoea formicae]MDF7648747.1 gamma-glutamyl-gamma-aminobutyrate hydrolase [Erwiniaceae bacterium L1_54_3]NIF03627.1 gamma-glutamyl-gamma-aminobutyrate hydrolase [Pantoea formicae]